MKRLILILGILILFIHPIDGHSKAKYHVIIDTDCGLDDLRAITIMLASTEFEVLAITTSDGVLAPLDGLKNVRSLLNSYGHQGIPTGAGIQHLRQPPVYRKYAEAVSWGEPFAVSTEDSDNAFDLIIRELENEEKPVILITLGSMTTYATLLKAKPDLLRELEKILWVDGGTNRKSGFNYLLDTISAKYVLARDIPIVTVLRNETTNLSMDDDFLKTSSMGNSRYINHLRSVFTSLPGSSVHSGMMNICDELLPVFLLDSINFTRFSGSSVYGNHTYYPERIYAIKELMRQVLLEEKEDQSIVFNTFPSESDMFLEDVAPMTEKIIARHGRKEWKIVVMTNEFHEHLGIYSIIGAKMGLRIREYFTIGIDEVTITSYAGSIPPVSCMNDGLQVSTGATLGHGTIHIAPDHSLPMADFSFKDKTVRCKLKKEFRDCITNEIRNAVNEFGLNTDGYWIKIRQLALKYWMELDRNDIFEISVLPAVTK